MRLEELFETASSGSTSSGCISSSIAGLGKSQGWFGFDNDHSKSIYPPPKKKVNNKSKKDKMAIVRRPPL